MSMQVIKGNFGDKTNPDLARQLRIIADQVDRGEVVDMVGSFIHNDSHVFMVASSLCVGLALATLLQDEIIQRFKDEEHDE